MDKDYFAVYELVVGFMVKNRVSCPECIWQSDSIQENMYEFIDNLYDAVSHDKRIKALDDSNDLYDDPYDGFDWEYD